MLTDFPAVPIYADDKAPLVFMERLKDYQSIPTAIYYLGIVRSHGTTHVFFNSLFVKKFPEETGWIGIGNCDE